jgi:hypothetical protein
MFRIALLLLLKVTYEEFYRRLEAVKSSLITLCFKSYFLKRHKEVVDMFQKCPVIVSKYNECQCISISCI